MCGGGFVLVEYFFFDYLEFVFVEIIIGWREKGIIFLIVDIGDIFYIFMFKLWMMGVNIEVEDFLVVKEIGNMRVGNIVGEVYEIEDFDYYMVKYV